MNLWSKLAVIAILACFTTVYAQQAVCTDLVQQAITTVDTACAPTGRNQACYGNISILATPRDGVSGLSFEKQGDLTNVADVASLQLQQLDAAKQIWGIALMKLQANLPDTLPGQNVTFVLFGDVKVDNAASGENVPTIIVTAGESSTVRTGPSPQYRIAGSIAKGQSAPASGRNADASWLLIQIPDSSSLGWLYTGYLSVDADVMSLPVVEAGKQEVSFKPMQAFYFSTGIGQSSCAAAPDGILIQTPKGAGQIALRANDVDIQLGSTAYLQAQAGGNMTISVVEGQGKVTAQGKTVIVPAGTQSKIPIDQDLKADGQPGNAQPYDASTLANLPISLLPLPITIAPPLTVQVYPTWTRAPRLPTATVTAPSGDVIATGVVTETPLPSPTYEPSPTEIPVGLDTISSGEDTTQYGNDTTYSGEDTTSSGEDTTQYGNDTTDYGNDSTLPDSGGDAPPTEQLTY